MNATAATPTNRRRAPAGCCNLVAVAAVLWLGFGAEGPTMTAASGPDAVNLPPPLIDGDVSLEQTLRTRRSIRRYRDAPLQITDIAQLLWAAQGVTDPGGLRTAPSAGATYPLEVYVMAGRVDGLPPGLYRYRPAQHALVLHAAGDLREELGRAALRQGAVSRAPAVIAVTGVYERTTTRYGERGLRYVHMEAGHAGQNICLQAAALRLGAVVIGAFHDRDLQRLLQLNANEHPLYLIPVGKME